MAIPLLFKNILQTKNVWKKEQTIGDRRLMTRRYVINASNYWTMWLCKRHQCCPWVFSVKFAVLCWNYSMSMSYLRYFWGVIHNTEHSYWGNIFLQRCTFLFGGCKKINWLLILLHPEHIRSSPSRTHQGKRISARQICPIQRLVAQPTLLKKWVWFHPWCSCFPSWLWGPEAQWASGERT